MNPGPRSWTFGGPEKMPRWVFRVWHNFGDGRLTALIKGKPMFVYLGDTIHAGYHGDVTIEKSETRLDLEAIERVEKMVKQEAKAA